MSKIQCLLTLFLLTAAFISNGQRKAVFIIVDGIPADVIEKVETPYLDEIAGKNGFTHAHVGGNKNSYSQSPTVSAVGYNHVLTGTWSNKHNVYDNDIKEPNYNYWNIFRIVKSQKKDAKTAMFSTWTDNRTKLIGEGLPQGGNFKFDYSFDGLELDTIRFPHTNHNYISDIDEKVSQEAASYILKEGPDISWVYLQFTDDMGHTYGDDPKFYEAVKKADNQIGRIWKSVKTRMEKHKEEWMIVVTTDHGRDSVSGKDHGGQSERERTTWIVTNGHPLNPYYKQSPGAVDIAPSILRFLKISPPESVKSEFDGVSFIGDLSICKPKAVLAGDKCIISWTPVSNDGELQISITTTNNLASGGMDIYQLVGRAKVAAGTYTFNLPATPKTDFLKILIRAPHNTATTWIVKDEMLKNYIDAK